MGELVVSRPEYHLVMKRLVLINRFILLPLGKHITRAEVHSLVDIFAVHSTSELANIPRKVFLKHTLTNNAELRAKCIQT